MIHLAVLYPGIDGETAIDNMLGLMPDDVAAAWRLGAVKALLWENDRGTVTWYAMPGMAPFAVSTWEEQDWLGEAMQRVARKLGAEVMSRGKWEAQHDVTHTIDKLVLR